MPDTDNALREKRGAPRWVECGADSELSVQREHTDCKTWGTERRCPYGMVDTGVSFGREDRSGDREMLKGIALQCSPIHD